MYIFFLFLVMLSIFFIGSLIWIFCHDLLDEVNNANRSQQLDLFIQHKEK